jgi:uncharacterized protein (DUF302 family)
LKYYISKKINTNFEQAVHLVTESLKEGFGILTEINLQEKLKEKTRCRFPEIQNTWCLQSLCLQSNTAGR